MKIIVFAFLFLGTVLARADLQKDCSAFYEHNSEVAVYRQYFKPDACFLSVTPLNTMSMIFRSYLITNGGMFLVFNSYGPGDESKMTGAREFMFFPRTKIPDRTVNGTKVSVQTANDKTKIDFNSKTNFLTKISGAAFTQDTHIVPTNQGGIVITKFNGLMLDVGYAQGHDPAEDRNRDAFFQDATGKKCAVKISEIFTPSQTDLEFAFPDDSGLKAFLSKRCPDLEFSLK